MNMLSNLTSSFSKMSYDPTKRENYYPETETGEGRHINVTTLRLPLVQYSVTMHTLGGSTHAPMNAFRLS